MGKTNFSKKAIEKFAPRESRYNVFDSQTTGLGVTVYPSGAKTFFHLRKVQGWPERTTLGPFPDWTVEAARGKASLLNANISKWKANNYEGKSPFEPREKVKTLGFILDDYIEKHLRDNAKNPDAAIRRAQWQFDRYLAPWRNRPLSSIQRKDVREKHAEIGARYGHVIANRVVTFLRTLFNHALDPDVALWEGANPARDPKKFLFHEESRERTIQKSEAPKFFEEFEKEPHSDLRDVVLLLLFTAARRGTVLAMRWDELDLERGLWFISNPKGMKKSKKVHTVPLVAESIAILKARLRTSEWVFPGRKGHLSTIDKPWRAFIARTGIKNIRIHDLRRTHATRLGDTGASTEIIQKALGHEEASAATKIYDRSDRRDYVRDAMAAAVDDILRQGKTSGRKLLAAASRRVQDENGQQTV